MGWQQHAACRGMDPALFFPTRGQDTRTIKAVCAECPVSAECLEMALEVGWAQDHGIFGGTSAKERRLIRKLRNRDERVKRMSPDELDLLVAAEKRAS